MSVIPIVFVILLAISIGSWVLCATMIPATETQRWQHMALFPGISVIVGGVLLHIFWRVFAASSKQSGKFRSAMFVPAVWTLYNFLIGPQLFTLWLQSDKIVSIPAVQQLLFFFPLYLHICVFVQLTQLSRGYLRPPVYRYLFSYPATIQFTLALLGILYIIALPFISPLAGAIVVGSGFVLCVLGLHQTLRTRETWEDVDVYMDGSLHSINGVQRYPQGHHKAVLPPETVLTRPLRVIIITDPHLGPIMSKERLRGIAQKAVDLNPDVLCLLGDFYTKEGSHEGILAEALAPLRDWHGHKYACLGNHDKEEAEIEEMTKRDLERVGVNLLVDDSTMIETMAGPVQIIGMDYLWRHQARKSIVKELYNNNVDKPEPVNGMEPLRLVMLHDPGCFKYIPAQENVIVFSGHTHGGQIGLWVLGTIVSWFTDMPDQGLFANGSNRLVQ